jgi:hypothetical protein
VEISATRGTKALVYYGINSSLYTGTVQGWWSTPNWFNGHQWCRQLSIGLPSSSGLGCKEETRGPTSWAVPIDKMGTLSVEAVNAPPVPGMQKPPRRVGKRFRDCFVAALEKAKVKKPAGLKTRPAWLWQDCLGGSPAVCRGDAGCQAWHPLPCRL